MQQVVLIDALTGVCLPQVRSGSPVSQDLQNYWDRVRTHSMNIEIRNVNYSDEGRYYLRDRGNRVVSVTRMDLTGGFPLLMHDIHIESIKLILSAIRQ